MTSNAQQNPELRGKIVQVLSSTANGCLSELGYHPGICQQLNEALKANNYLQQANDKLFEDNRSLARLVSFQNDRLALVDGTESSRLKTFTDMENRVKVLIAEKADLVKRNSLLVQSLPTSDVLVAELKNLQISHNILQREYIRLRESYNSLYKTSASRSILPGTQVHSPEGSNSNYQVSNANTNTYHRRASEGQVPAEAMTSFMNQWQVPLAAQHPGAPFQGSYAHRSTSGQEPNHSHVGPSSHKPSSWTTLTRYQDMSAPVSHPDITVSNGVGQMYPKSNLNTQKGKDKDPLTPLALNARNLPTTLVAQHQSAHILQGQSTAAHAGQSQQMGTGLAEETHVQEPVTQEPTTQVPITGDIASQYFTILPPTPSPKASLAGLLGAPSTVPVNLAQEGGVDQRKLPAQESTDLSGKYPQAAFDTAMHTDIMANYASNEQGDVINGEAPTSKEDCVAIIFDGDEEVEGKQTCNLCTMRFEKGLVEEPPKVFQHAALDVLVAHCVEEHLVVWEKLRHSPPYDD